MTTADKTCQVSENLAGLAYYAEHTRKGRNGCNQRCRKPSFLHRVNRKTVQLQPGWRFTAFDTIPLLCRHQLLRFFIRIWQGTQQLQDNIVANRPIGHSRCTLPLTFPSGPWDIYHLPKHVHYPPLQKCYPQPAM